MLQFDNFYGSWKIGRDLFFFSKKKKFLLDKSAFSTFRGVPWSFKNLRQRKKGWQKCVSTCGISSGTRPIQERERMLQSPAVLWLLSQWRCMFFSSCKKSRSHIIFDVSKEAFVFQIHSRFMEYLINILQCIKDWLYTKFSWTFFFNFENISREFLMKKIECHAVIRYNSIIRYSRIRDFSRGSLASTTTVPLTAIVTFLQYLQTLLL